MPAATDKFMKVGMSTATTLSAPGYTIGNTSITVGSTTNWPTDTGITFAIDTVTVVNGVEVQDAGSYNEYVGTVATGTTITNVAWADGDGNKNYSAGSTTRVYIPVSKTRENRLVDGMLVEHKQTGAHGTVTADSITVTGNVTAANFVQTGGSGADGWTVGLATPNTVTCNGNRSYDLVFNGTDLTGTLSPGMRLRTERTVPAPTQCTSLNGTTQYYSKSSPAGMTFTDDFTCMAWVKPSAYALGGIISRHNGSTGWIFYVTATGQLRILGQGAGNHYYDTYQSIPLNKWTHVAASFDMSGNVGTLYIDGIAVPKFETGSGTYLTQAGNLEVGSFNGTHPFPGKIAQAAVFNAVLSASTIRSYMSQGLSGSETSLISAYSFDNSINDLNTTNANNLTANGSAVATNADSPFGGQASGSISSTLDYAIIQKATFSTNTTLTVQVPEGCTIPTSGGVSAVSYSTQKAPYGFPSQSGKWAVSTLIQSRITIAFGAITNWFESVAYITVPVGQWKLGYSGPFDLVSSVSGNRRGRWTLVDTAPTNGVYTYPLTVYQESNSSATDGIEQHYKDTDYTATTQSVNKIWTQIVSASGSEQAFILGDLAPVVLFAENAYL